MIDSSTICALSTASGGAIAVIRTSGPRAIELTSAVFSKPLTDVPAYRCVYGEIKDANGGTIDDVLVTVFRAPHSYTGEDATEISCNGSKFIVSSILQRLIEVGWRQAEPGEYTQRAYLNGKMDLSQAEAVADLIASTNKATHRMALSQLKGHFSSELAQLREQLLKLTSLLELELDFSDHEELEFADRTELRHLSEHILEHVDSLAQSFKTGKAIKQGVPVAIVGKTNVGKSTLLNRLLHEEKAIVSNVHGTTRDVIEDTTEINGVTFRFIDTAGIRNTDDTVEQLGIERTYQQIDQASIVLWVFDTPPTSEELADMQQRCADKKLVMVKNKVDQEEALSPSYPLTLSPSLPLTSTPFIPISAKLGTGITELESAIYVAADIPEVKENDVIVTSARHYQSLTLASDSLHRVLDAMDMNLSGDLIAEDLKDVLANLAQITGGQISSQETLNNIFKHFCIGK